MTGVCADLGDLGWDESWREALRPEHTPGRVARVDRGLCLVLTAAGPVRASLGADVLDAAARDPVENPCTGDWCGLRSWPDGPVTLEEVAPRRAVVVRAEASRGSNGQALAANADAVGVVVGLHPEPNIVRVERLLTVAWASGARPVVILTKADLVPDQCEVAEDVAAAAPGVEVLVCSAATGEGLAAVRALVPAGRTLALLGASGHGKSSLANRLVGAEVLGTRAIRDDGKGRHTTVRRELVVVPGGGVVIDTPGLRSVGLQRDEGALAAAFPDVDELARRCAFRDCRHDAEPGCAVLDAVAAGRLSVRRWESWRSLSRDLETAHRRSRARERRERRRTWRDART